MITSKAYEEQRLKMLAAAVEGVSVLDVGYAQYPNHYLQAENVVGLDLNAPKAPSGYAEEVVGNALDVEKLFPGRQFDTILCGELIEHLENPYELLRALKKVLKPGGKLVLTTPNPMSFPVGVAEMLRLRRFFYTKDHLYYFLPRWVHRMIENTGYTLEETSPIGLWTPWAVLPSPVAFSYQVLYVARAPA